MYLNSLDVFVNSVKFYDWLDLREGLSHLRRNSSKEHRSIRKTPRLDNWYKFKLFFKCYVMNDIVLNYIMTNFKNWPNYAHINEPRHTSKKNLIAFTFYNCFVYSEDHKKRAHYYIEFRSHRWCNG